MRFLLAVCLIGCGNNHAATPDACPSFQAGAIGGARPVDVHVPPGYDACTAMPLVVMLHGYSGTGAIEESYLKLTPLADARGFLYAHPDGTRDAMNNEFWNATDACCDVYGTNVDDSTYLHDLIVEIGEHYNLDPKRTFVMGHSNGGFMSHRMACDHADQIAAIASLAGATFADGARCAPSNPVAMLEIHGTSDAVISYTGGSITNHAYPGAVATTAAWASLDGCASAADTSAPPLDLDSSLPGAETTVTRYPSCQPGGDAQLWSIQGGSHIPVLSATFSAQVIDFLLAHPKP